MEKRKLGKNGDSLMTASAAVAVGEKNLTKFRTSTAVPFGIAEENTFFLSCIITQRKLDHFAVDISKVSLRRRANLQQKPDRK